MSAATAALPGVLLGGLAERQGVLAAADAAIRAPLALSRRIGFAQVAGGAGASTVAAAVAGVIARRRGGAVLAVDAAAGPRSLGWHLGLGDAVPTPPSSGRARPRSQQEALDGLPLAATGAALLDVHDPDGRAVAEGAWASQVAPLVRFCPVVCTDWGVRGPGADLAGVAAASSTVCLVARADRGAVERSLAAAEALLALPGGPAVVLAVVDVGRTAARLPRGFAADAAVPVVRVPFEPARRRPEPVDGAACSAATRSALIALAAAVMGAEGRR